MPEQEHIVTLRITEGNEQLILALERIDTLERLLNDATHFIANELKRIACRPAEAERLNSQTLAGAAAPARSQLRSFVPQTSAEQRIARFSSLP